MVSQSKYIGVNIKLGVIMIYRLNLREKLKSYTSEYKPLLNNRSLVMLVFAGIISSFGSKITYFALLRKVYTITEGKIASLGALTVFEILPSIIFGAIAGFIIDKISRKWSMVVSDIFKWCYDSYSDFHTGYKAYIFDCFSKCISECI